jgi:hypothetical protein
MRPCAQLETVGDPSQGRCCLASEPARDPHLGRMPLAFGFEPFMDYSIFTLDPWSAKQIWDKDDNVLLSVPKISR